MAISETTKKMKAKIAERARRAWERPANLKQALMDTMAWVPKDQQITVFLSGGIDSHACLFACLELGLNVNVVSFTLDTHESTDFKTARNTARIFDLPFFPVRLKTTEEHLKKWVLYAVQELGLDSKSNIECMWPLYGAIKMAAKIGSKHVVCGMGADPLFLMAKDVSMHGQPFVKEIRRAGYRVRNTQRELLKRLSFDLGMYAHAPYNENGRVYAEILRETDWKVLNTPQKALLNQAWPELKKMCKVRAHQNFQLGDTNISGIFSDRLLASDWNVRNLKSVVGIYNDVVSGAITKI